MGKTWTSGNKKKKDSETGVLRWGVAKDRMAEPEWFTAGQHGLGNGFFGGPSHHLPADGSRMSQMELNIASRKTLPCEDTSMQAHAVHQAQAMIRQQNGPPPPPPPPPKLPLSAQMQHHMRLGQTRHDSAQEQNFSSRNRMCNQHLPAQHLENPRFATEQHHVQSDQLSEHDQQSVRHEGPRAPDRHDTQQQQQLLLHPQHGDSRGNLGFLSSVCQATSSAASHQFNPGPVRCEMYSHAKAVLAPSTMMTSCDPQVWEKGTAY